MKFEFSAGGIVFKPIRQAQGKKDYLILVAQHSQHHGWIFPKGLIGDHPSTGSGQAKKETKEQAALREVEEETGIVAKIKTSFEPVVYWFVFKGEKVKKTVYYFLMEYVSGDTKNHDFEMESVEWLPKDEVLERLSYPSDKKVWQAAQKMLE